MTKIVIVSDTRIKGKPTKEGDVHEVDEQTSDGTQLLGELNAASRIVLHGSDGHKLWEADQVKAKAKAEAKAKADK